MVKKSNRRNPWGPYSYADLITMAITGNRGQSSLSDIYKWIIENVDYFKDKKGGNSSDGWRVSNLIVYLTDICYII